MPTEVISILMQLPVVMVFIYYFDKRERQTQDLLDRKDKQFLDSLREEHKQFLDFLREERAERGKQFDRIMSGQDAIAEELRCLTAHMDEHDTNMTTAIVVMREKVGAGSADVKTQPRRQNQSQTRGGGNADR